MSELVPASVPLNEQVACVKRELGFRVRLYPRWVDQHKMTQAKADREIEAMRAVLATLEAQQTRETPASLL